MRTIQPFCSAEGRIQMIENQFRRSFSLDRIHFVFRPLRAGYRWHHKSKRLFEWMHSAVFRRHLIAGAVVCALSVGLCRVPSSRVIAETVSEDPTQSLLERLTLQEKIGQLFVVGVATDVFGEPELRRISRYHMGGFALFAKNASSAEALSRLVLSLQRYNEATHRHLGKGVPLLIASDQEPGAWQSLKGVTTAFPSPGRWPPSIDGETARLVGLAMGRELRALGIAVNWAPVLDVNSNPANPIIGVRAFGRTAGRVSELGLAYARGLRQAGILAVGKHFPGHGDTSVDSHKALPRVDHSRERLESIEFAPFREGVKNGLDAIMTAHLWVPALDPVWPATLSGKTVAGLLRREWGFQGLVFSDDLGMGALVKNYPLTEASERALLAGVDILVHVQDRQGEPPEVLADYLVGRVRAGGIPIEVIDRAVGRILRIKRRYEMNRLPDLHQARMGFPKHHALAKRLRGSP
jgi:beta-N-acetylhexosaminidase